MRLENLGLIGNCQFAALIDNEGRVVWCCWPRFDSEPVFGALLDDEGGTFSVSPESGRPGIQMYEPNTNILVTTFAGPDGSFRVIDFAPRFLVQERPYRPTQLWRIVEPISGMPRVRVRCQPVLGWSKEAPRSTPGSHHVEYEGFSQRLRLSTDVPLAYLDGQAMTLTERRHLAMTWGPPVEEPLPPIADRYLTETRRYWQRWVKHADVPASYQKDVIRSALTLKLHCYEDTGAIVAAVTTSIPEAAGSGRTWDYRYCWLRDAFYVLDAFRLLGHFEEREGFLRFLLDLAGGSPNLDLAPLYRIDGSTELDERILTNWKGFEGDGPVRVGNGAAKHVQNDVFGELVLALLPLFVDDRFEGERSPAAWNLFERLARKAIAVVGVPDAGIWEYRKDWAPQTFSTLMSWAAADRAAVVALRHGRASEPEFRLAAARIRETILTEAWSEEIGALAGAWQGRDLDASLLQAARLRLLPPDDPRLIRTIEAIRDGLTANEWLQRYRANDGLGDTSVAFLICSFWLAEAYVTLGRPQDARDLIERTGAIASPLGLLAEDYDPVARRLGGNFPQAYSHVGLIHAAFAASLPWSGVM